MFLKYAFRITAIMLNGSIALRTRLDTVKGEMRQNLNRDCNKFHRVSA